LTLRILTPVLIYSDLTLLTTTILSIDYDVSVCAGLINTLRMSFHPLDYSYKGYNIAIALRLQYDL